MAAARTAAAMAPFCLVIVLLLALAPADEASRDVPNKTPTTMTPITASSDAKTTLSSKKSPSAAIVSSGSSGVHDQKTFLGSGLGVGGGYGAGVGGFAGVGGALGGVAGGVGGIGGVGGLGGAGGGIGGLGGGGLVGGGLGGGAGGLGGGGAGGLGGLGGGGGYHGGAGCLNP